MRNEEYLKEVNFQSFYKRNENKGHKFEIKTRLSDP